EKSNAPAVTLRIGRPSHPHPHVMAWLGSATPTSLLRITRRAGWRQARARRKPRTLTRVGAERTTVDTGVTMPSLDRDGAGFEVPVDDLLAGPVEDAVEAACVLVDRF